MIVAIEYKAKLPKLTTIELRIIACGLSAKRLNELEMSYRVQDEIDPEWRLRHQGDRQKFVEAVREWLMVELTEEEKVMIYCPERPMAPYIMCHIAVQFKANMRNHAQRMARIRAARLGVDEQEAEEETDEDEGGEDEEGEDEEGEGEEGEVGMQATPKDVDMGAEDNMGQQKLDMMDVDQDRSDSESDSSDSSEDNEQMRLDILDPDPNSESDGNDELNHSLDNWNGEAFADHSTFLDMAGDAFENNPNQFQNLLDVMQDAGQNLNPNKEFTMSQLDKLIAAATELRAQIPGWNDADFDADKIGPKYKALQDLIPIPAPPMVPQAADLAGFNSKRFLNFHVKIRGNIAGFQDILARGTFATIWDEVTNSEFAIPFRNWINFRSKPLFVVAAGPSGGGKTHSMIRPNAEDPPLLQLLLMDALKRHGTLKLKVTTMLAKHSVVEFDQFLLHDLQIPQFMQNLIRHIPTAGNGVNHLSSRRHVVIDVFSEGLLILSLLDLCGDESSEVRARSDDPGHRVRGQRDDPGHKESRHIANDLLFLRTLLSDLKLHRVSRLPSTKARRAKGIMGRGCALTGGFLSRLTLVPKVHVVMFGNGDGDKRNFVRSLDVWKPLVPAKNA